MADFPCLSYPQAQLAWDTCLFSPPSRHHQADPQAPRGMVPLRRVTQCSQPGQTVVTACGGVSGALGPTVATSHWGCPWRSLVCRMCERYAQPFPGTCWHYLLSADSSQCAGSLLSRGASLSRRVPNREGGLRPAAFAAQVTEEEARTRRAGLPGCPCNQRTGSGGSQNGRRIWLSHSGTMITQDLPAIFPDPPGSQGGGQGAEQVFTGSVGTGQVTGKHSDSSSWTQHWWGEVSGPPLKMGL